MARAGRSLHAGGVSPLASWRLTQCVDTVVENSVQRENLKQKCMSLGIKRQARLQLWPESIPGITMTS